MATVPFRDRHLLEPHGTPIALLIENEGVKRSLAQMLLGEVKHSLRLLGFGKLS